MIAAVPARFQSLRWGVVGAAVAPPLLLLLTRLLPAEGVGLAARLAAATVCVLLLPGALLLRAVAWPREPGLAVAGSLALSLAIAFAAFALTFALDASLGLTIAAGGIVALLALVPAASAYVPRAALDPRAVFLGIGGAALAFAALLWWTTDVLGTGDVLFHLARARKIAEADVLASVDVANEYRDGGLHPGYAFPLWHGVLALVARLAAVDVALVALHLNSVLVPIAFAVAYAAGRALFASWAGGVAVLAAQVAQLGFSRGGTGSFGGLALPASITRVVLVPALLALAFAFLREGGRRTLLPLAAAALAVAVIHPTYLIFAAIPLGAFALVWIVVTDDRRRDGVRLGLAGAAMLAPGVMFFLWLLPVITSTASHAPTASEEARALAHYGDQLQRVGDAYRAAPTAVTRAGPVVIGALAFLPLVALWGRRIWALFAACGMLAALAILLAPDLFTRFSDLVSISQSRRLAQFMPVSYVVAAAAVVAGRLRLAAALAALGCGVLLELLYSTEKGHVVEQGGPVWPLWVAAVGAPLALVVGFSRVSRRLPDAAPAAGWAAAVALAFVAPIAIGGLASLDRRDDPDAAALTPGLVEALNAAPAETVVLAPVPTAYRAAAFAPVYVVATPPPNAADTDENRPYRRQREAIRFFAPRSGMTDGERRRLIERYGADLVLVDKHQPYPRAFVESLPSVYEDGRYALFRVSTR